MREKNEKTFPRPGGCGDSCRARRRDRALFSSSPTGSSRLPPGGSPALRHALTVVRALCTGTKASRALARARGRRERGGPAWRWRVAGSRGAAATRMRKRKRRTRRGGWAAFPLRRRRRPNTIASRSPSDRASAARGLDGRAGVARSRSLALLDVSEVTAASRASAVLCGATFSPRSRARRRSINDFAGRFCCAESEQSPLSRAHTEKSIIACTCRRGRFLCAAAMTRRAAHRATKRTRSPRRRRRRPRSSSSIRPRRLRAASRVGMARGTVDTTYGKVNIKRVDLGSGGGGHGSVSMRGGARQGRHDAAAQDQPPRQPARRSRRSACRRSWRRRRREGEARRRARAWRTTSIDRAAVTTTRTLVLRLQSDAHSTRRSSYLRARKGQGGGAARSPTS